MPLPPDRACRPQPVREMVSADTCDTDTCPDVCPQGVFNGVSAGILLYVGFSMASEDFSREDVVKDGKLSAAMALCIFTSAFCMSLLAMWA